MEGFTTNERGVVGGSPTTRRRRTFASTAAVIAAAALTLVATSAGAAVRGPALQRHLERHTTSPVIIDSAKRGAFGAILVTRRGYTLYYDKSDTATKIACVGGCAQIWPPVLLPSGVHSATAGPGVSRSALGVVHRPGGGIQVTYAGHPLYSYVGDSAPGQTKGEGVGGFYVVKASASKAPSTPTTTTPSGGGYGGY